MNRLVLRLALVLATIPACARSTPKEPEAEQPIPVTAEAVRLGTVRGVVSATGVVTPLAGATFIVSAHQPARIAEITKNAGDSVKSGELLVRFEFPSLRPQLAVNAAVVKAAELRLQQARLAQSRISSLISRGAASQREMEDADREVAAAEAELRAAVAAMRLTESTGQNADVRAPFNGTVIERLHNPGDLVRAGDDDPILRLIDPRQVQVTATVAVPDLTRFSVGSTARAIAALERSPGAGAAEQLMRVVSRPEPERGATTVPVALAFESSTDLTPGTQVGIEIDAEQRSNVPVVPSIAVLQIDTKEPYVMVAVGTAAQRRAVTIGITDGDRVEIRSGLKAGELVITQGHSSLRDEAPITVASP